MTEPTRPENLLEILQRLYPGIDVEPLQRMMGGRQWIYVPSTRPQSQAEKREAIRRDPCRDYKVVCRRYQCSIALVYNVWNEKTG